MLEDSDDFSDVLIDVSELRDLDGIEDSCLARALKHVLAEDDAEQVSAFSSRI
jgi:FXSXX-COOH protein